MQLTADETTLLGDSVRAVCDQLATEERVRAAAYGGDGTDSELWRVLTSKVGVAAIAIPQDHGGAGYGAAALAVVAHELGRVLAPVPFLSSAVLATGLLVETADVADEAFALLATGERTAAAILGLEGGPWTPGTAIATASRIGSGWTLTGAARHVLGALSADLLIVVALPDHSNEPAVFVLDADGEGVTRAPERVLDATRPMATVSLAASPARRLTGHQPVAAGIARALHRAIAVLSAEQVGSHERVLEIAVDYARTREQFGRTIGSFQAVKHRCADMLVNLEWSRSASQAALEAADVPTGAACELGWRASMAKAVCSEAFRDASHANLQIHGGIGFTWEDSAHLYLRRARTDEVLFGGPSMHWEQLRQRAELL